MPISRVGIPVVFFTPNHQWVIGKVTSYDSVTNTYSCCATDPEFVVVHNVPCNSNNLWFPRADLLIEDVDDLLNLTELHEAPLLLSLKKRYEQDVVYTNIGPILIALNPFTYSIPWYADSKMEDYLAEGAVIKNNVPHLWSTAHNTYWDMRESAQNQSILVSGESGAGKTEATKILLKYFGALSAKNGKIDYQEAFIQVSKRVLASSPILECFGNAKTVCNDNSSRFGKFLKVQFDRDGNLIGCHVTKYLLERSRIVAAPKGERVYHSFYQLARGPLAKTFFLRNPRVYRLLNAGECIHIDGVDDAASYATTKQAMDDVGITDEEQLFIWRIVAGVLFLQNTDFVETEDYSGYVTKIDPNLLTVFTRACELWGVNEELLRKELVSTSIMAQREQTVKPLNRVMALDARDSICKSLYDWLFDWLVLKINETTNQEKLAVQWIGLLDIFGFENFQRNGFEQLCINLANEVLQGHYNQHIFTADMRVCQEEGIDTANVEFADNNECVELLMGKFGIFRLLDEECAISGNESNYLQKLLETFGSSKTKKGNTCFLQATGRAVDSHFIVRHYAADVQYNVEGFLNKNRDTLKPAMRHILLQSKVPLIAALVPKDEGKMSLKGTVGGYFINQLTELISVINKTNPQWIRCIRPNADKQPRVFSSGMVINQLRSAGVLETVKLRKAGYPIRLSFDEVTRRYRVLCRHGLYGREACEQMLQNCAIGAAEAQLGRTKLFMKSEGYLKLNHCRDLAALYFIRCIQAAGRGGLARVGLSAVYVLRHRQRILEERRVYEEALKKEREMKEAKERAERMERENQERLLRERLHKAAVSIQRLIRGFLSRRKFFIMYISILRAREEYHCDDEQRKYREYEAGANQRISALVAQLSARKDTAEQERICNRRELLRKRRGDTMQFIEERRFLNETRLKEVIKQDSVRRAKERTDSKKREQEALKLTHRGQRQCNLFGTQSGAEQRYLDEAQSILAGNVVYRNRQNVCTGSSPTKRSSSEDLAFAASRQYVGEMESWLDEREFMLGSRSKAHGLLLTSRQRKLEEQYRIQTVSKIMWELDAEKAAFSFRKQRSFNNGELPMR